MDQYQTMGKNAKDNHTFAKPKRFHLKCNLPRSPQISVQCSPANPGQAGEEAVGLADWSGLPSSSCVLVGE